MLRNLHKTSECQHGKKHGISKLSHPNRIRLHVTAPKVDFPILHVNYLLHIEIWL